MGSAIIPIPKPKLVLAKDLPGFLDDRRARLAAKLDAEGFPRFPYSISDSKKRQVLETIFDKHWDILKPFFHPQVQMVGGVAKNKPTPALLEELAALVHSQWGGKDGWRFSKDEYLQVLRELNGPTPIFIYHRPNNEVEGAVFPEQVQTASITTWDGTTHNSTWKSDTIFGDVGVCPRICSYMQIGGVGKNLIANGALPYFTVLAYFNYIYDLLAYSRPSEFGPLRANGTSRKEGRTILTHLPRDQTYKFHMKNGGYLVGVVPDGVNEHDKEAGRVGFIAGYKRNLVASGELLAVLQQIGADVAKLIGLGA